MDTPQTFHGRLKGFMDQFALSVYQISRTFPKEELYGITSQLRRASLSVPLNYLEGHGRMTDGARMQFLRISFGSLKESMYLIDFCSKIGLLPVEKHAELQKLGRTIYSMLWGILRKTRET